MSCAEMSEIRNETSWVKLSSRTLSNFKKRAAKTFHHGDQTISVEESAVGKRSASGFHL